MELSRSAARRLDELCEEWAVWITRRWEDRPGLEVSDWHAWALDSGRQWRETYELDQEALLGAAPLLAQAIAKLPPQHMALLLAWAWENHYNREVIRKVEKTEDGTRVTHGVFKSNHARVTEESLMAAQQALAPLLEALNIVLE